MDSLERFRQLAEWLAETDIAVLELRGPGTSIRLDRHPGATRDPRGHHEPGLHPGYGHASATVRSPGVGILRHRHPLHDTALAVAGQRVVEGQALALLQVENTLVPALAPRDAVVARVVAADGDAVGYGDPLVELLD